MTVAARSHSKDEPSQAVSTRTQRPAQKKGRRVLRLRNVSLHNQHEHLVLNSVSASFTRGTISAILTGYRDLPWPPAQEPSPFLLACAGLTPLDSGRISWPRPRSLAARFRGDLEPIGYVPRRAALNDELTVEQELMLALAATGRFADHQAMLSLCRILVLTPLLNAQVALLTPFERLRTAIARALITGSPVLLVEEPTEFLSVEESEDLFGHFFELADMGYSIIVATRSPDVAAQSDQALILIDGEVVGNISQPDYHALNLAFSTALKNPQSGSAMSWVTPPSEGIVTIDDDELIDTDEDADSPSMHPTWAPVTSSSRERQLRPIPLAVPPVVNSASSNGASESNGVSGAERRHGAQPASSAQGRAHAESSAARPAATPATAAVSGGSAAAAASPNPAVSSTSATSPNPPAGPASATTARASASPSHEATSTRLFPPVTESFARTSTGMQEPATSQASDAPHVDAGELAATEILPESQDFEAPELPTRADRAFAAQAAGRSPRGSHSLIPPLVPTATVTTPAEEAREADHSHPRTLDAQGHGAPNPPPKHTAPRHRSHRRAPLPLNDHASADPAPHHRASLGRLHRSPQPRPADPHRIARPRASPRQ
ncbi:hypothetical protein [Schaalia sp. Marseille-Q2122]|uniref:hypothetical protein n=1 Tax=Schaalia sp. Marseille-Q2122 TaxID=2736604 RepID=UPI00158B7694|nr:hypothetical protein [Schaalia sp. Marseille-Q2122]